MSESRVVTNVSHRPKVKVEMPLGTAFADAMEMAFRVSREIGLTVEYPFNDKTCVVTARGTCICYSLSIKALSASVVENPMRIYQREHDRLELPVRWELETKDD